CSVEVVDLRTLVPLDRETACASLRKTSKALLLHQDTRTGGPAGGGASPPPLQPPAGGGLPAQCGKGRRESSLAVSLLSWRWPPPGYPLGPPPTTAPGPPRRHRRARWFWKTPAAIAPCSPKPNSASPRPWPISWPRDCWFR